MSIECANLVKSYGRKEIIKDISVSIREGVITGLIGPNGAGKSTTMNILTGFLSMTSGSVSIAGLDILDNPLEAKKHIGYLPEQPPLYVDMTVDEYLNFVYEIKGCKLNRAKHLEEVRKGMEEAADAFAALQIGHGWYDNWIDVLADILAPWDTRGEYTRAERLQLAKLAAQYEWASSDAENDILCAVLELITGRAWDYSTLRGCCQGDWQEIIYPAEYGRAWLEEFEAEYFNTGDEWRINEGDPDSGDNYYFYSHGWNDELIRQEIADAAGVDPGDVVLFKFTGWSRTASYEEVTA